MMMMMTMRKIGTCFCKFSICAALFVKTATINNLQDEYCHNNNNNNNNIY